MLTLADVVLTIINKLNTLNKQNTVGLYLKYGRVNTIVLTLKQVFYFVSSAQTGIINFSNKISTSTHKQ